MTSRIGSNQPAPRRTGTTSPLPTTPRPQAPRPVTPADRARLANNGDATLRRNLAAAPQVNNDDLLDRALAVIQRPVDPNTARLRAGLDAARAAIRASGVARPVQLLPRLAQSIGNGISRGFQLFGNFVRSSASQVVSVVNRVRERVSDLASQVVNTVKGEAVRLFASAAQFVRREFGLNPLPYQELDNPPSAAETTTPEARAAEATARQQLADPARREQAQQAIQALPEPQRQAYQSVFDGLADTPRAQAALQDLAIRGRLAERDMSGGRTMMENLSALASQPVAAGLNNRQLLSEVVQEVANPVGISQESRNTCGATTAQIYLANRNGAEYVRLVSGLASPEGNATLQDGTAMSRDPNWNLDDGGRTSSSRLLQPAFMDVASFGDYQNDSDTHEMFGTGLGYPGVMPGRMRNLMESMTGQDFTLDLLGQSESYWRSSTPENPLPVAMNYNVEGGQTVSPHWVQVTGFRPDTNQVEIINPWGRRELLSESDFERRIIATVPRNS